jgi:hypothetical protein
MFLLEQKLFVWRSATMVIREVKLQQQKQQLLKKNT